SSGRRLTALIVCVQGAYDAHDRRRCSEVGQDSRSAYRRLGQRRDRGIAAPRSKARRSRRAVGKCDDVRSQGIRARRGGATRDEGSLAEDPASPPPVGSRDPDDDYLLALAINRRAYLVTGDQDLLVLSDDLPILTPAQVATKLRETS